MNARNNTDDADQHKDLHLNQICREYAYDELFHATCRFCESNRIGYGTYGSVFRGVLDDGTEVAIKVLDSPKDGGFEEEVRVLSKFRHPNLVLLLGFARDNDKRFIVYELLSGGDVGARLHKGHRLGWHHRLTIATEAACGLSHLHNSNPKVFHRDVKSANILLDKRGTAKWGDFGLACLSLDKAQRVPQAAGTVGYADPQYIASSIVTENSEVFSFGWVLIELLTARPPAVQRGGQLHYLYPHIRDECGAASLTKVCSMVDNNAGFPKAVAQSFAQIALWCIHENSLYRPDFRTIVKELRSICNETDGLRRRRTLDPRDCGVHPLQLRFPEATVRSGTGYAIRRPQERIENIRFSHDAEWSRNRPTLSRQAITPEDPDKPISKVSLEEHVRCVVGSHLHVGSLNRCQGLALASNVGALDLRRRASDSPLRQECGKIPSPSLCSLSSLLPFKSSHCQEAQYGLNQRLSLEGARQPQFQPRASPHHESPLVSQGVSTTHVIEAQDSTGLAAQNPFMRRQVPSPRGHGLLIADTTLNSADDPFPQVTGFQGSNTRTQREGAVATRFSRTNSRKEQNSGTKLPGTDGAQGDRSPCYLPGDTLDSPQLEPLSTAPPLRDTSPSNVSDRTTGSQHGSSARQQLPPGAQLSFSSSNSEEFHATQGPRKISQGDCPFLKSVWKHGGRDPGGSDVDDSFEAQLHQALQRSERTVTQEEPAISWDGRRLPWQETVFDAGHLGSF